jgi:hypothetical protein
VGFFAAVAAKRTLKWVQGRRRGGCKRSKIEIEGCQHTLKCACSEKYRAYRQRNLRRKCQRVGAPTLLRQVWDKIPQVHKQKHLSLAQCKKYGISYQQVSRPARENDFLTNLRHLCVRVILGLKSKGNDFLVIPKAKYPLYSLARRLATIQMNEQYFLIGQRPHLHRRASIVTDYNFGHHHDDSSSQEDAYYTDNSLELPLDAAQQAEYEAFQKFISEYSQ